MKIKMRFSRRPMLLLFQRTKRAGHRQRKRYSIAIIASERKIMPSRKSGYSYVKIRWNIISGNDLQLFMTIYFIKVIFFLRLASTGIENDYALLP